MRSTSLQLPQSDSEALAWLENLHRRLAPRPGAFGVDERDLATLAERIETYRLAVARANARADHGPGSHGATERALARNAVVASAQLLAGMIAAHPLTTADDLTLLGLPSEAVSDQQSAFSDE